VRRQNINQKLNYINDATEEKTMKGYVKKILHNTPTKKKNETKCIKNKLRNFI